MKLKSGEQRIWAKVEIEDYQAINRPESQGGTWVLANKMRVIEILKSQ